MIESLAGAIEAVGKEVAEKTSSFLENLESSIDAKQPEGVKSERSPSFLEKLESAINAKQPEGVQEAETKDSRKGLESSKKNGGQAEISSKPDLPSEIPSAKIDVVAGETSDAPEKKGGSYREVKENSDGDTHEVHHMPADSASTLERNDGPAIKMEKEDHRQTASCGSSREAREYRAQQQELIEQGKFREALQMDIDDIHEKFGDKYDDAISEMLEYVDKLEQEGKING